jgi:hypothetical protein
MKATVKVQTLSTEAQNLFVELVNIELSKYARVSVNMLSNTIQFFSQLLPFNTVSENYLITLCHNKGVKVRL